jgi:hypothetical protein
MNRATGVRTAPTEQMRVARLLEARGDAIGAVLAYGEIIRAGIEPEATEARLRVGALARKAWPAASI